EPLRLELHVALVAGLPAAAVDPEHHGQILRIRRRINIEHLSLVGIVDVGDAALGWSWRGRGGGLSPYLDLEQQDGGNKQCDDGFHGWWDCLACGYHCKLSRCRKVGGICSTAFL